MKDLEWWLTHKMRVVCNTALTSTRFQMPEGQFLSLWCAGVPSGDADLAGLGWGLRSRVSYRFLGDIKP